MSYQKTGGEIPHAEGAQGNSGPEESAGVKGKPRDSSTNLQSALLSARARKRTTIIGVAVNREDLEIIDKRIEILFKNAIGRSTYLRHMGLKGKLT